MKSSIYQRKSDMKWVGSISLGTDVFGKRKRKTVYGDTEKEVRKKVNKLLYELETGEYTETSKESLVSFLNEFYEIKKYSWAKTTSALYKMYIDVHFEPYFKKMKLKELTTTTLDKFYAFKMDTVRIVEIKTKNGVVKQPKSPMSVNTVIKLHKFLNMALDYAVKNKFIKENVATNVVIGKKQKFKPSIYDENEFEKLLDNVAGTDDEIPIILGAGCGMRRGEIFGLQWEDIDFANNTIQIKNTAVRFDKHLEKEPKTDTSKRILKAPEYVVSTLEKYYKKKNNPPKTEKVLTRWLAPSYSERYKKIIKEFNLKHTRLHDLRHYNAVIMMKNNIPDKVAAQRLGHSSTTTLREVYQHVMGDMDEIVASELNSMFGNKK